MLGLDDPRWKELLGGRKLPFDASHLLSELERGDDVWHELWDGLHHQGDVGDASYAAVPHLVRIAETFEQRDWNVYALASTIEIERHAKRNPPLPDWLAESYHAAWDQLLAMALRDLRDARDRLTIQAILGAVALAKGNLELGTLISYAD